MNNRDRYLNWVLTQIQYYGTYHNHKETMAWVATALYIPSIITLSVLSSKLASCWFFLVNLITIIIFAIIVVCFIHRQFRNRWIAHYYSVGFMLTASKLCKDKNYPNTKDCITEEKDRFPKFIQNNINEAEDKKENNLVEDKRDMEWISYTAVILATLVALVIICISHCTEMVYS